MYNVVVFGTGSVANEVTKNVNNNTNILCYLDNDKEKWNKILHNKNICSPEKIECLDYDFIIIASQYTEEIYNQLIKLDINSEKIFEYINFFNMANDRFEHKMINYKSHSLDYDTIITGISYFVSGISEDNLNRRGINFSYDSQDLYYDYYIVKYILENCNNNLKYCIIGLNYYSFEYDLSLSAMKNNVYLYLKKLKKSHHLEIDKYFEKRIDINKKIANKILNLIKGKSTYGVDQKEKQLIEAVNRKEMGRVQATLDCNKNYPVTVSENKQILKEYLELLKSYNIKPIIVVCPTSKYYYENFSDRIEKEFFSIIKEISHEYDFQYIDYFRNDSFYDEDFKDVSHLNIKGGIKFTKILNEKIKW
ncbi:chemotaxis protein [uncultured Clostridium sp.]|uniref:chemotaxis protein n=1 Tax=uncultured Clostridium sp. TaxID=59620 RepID=UPI0028E25D8B|nr:chemotaxis protein [uncultured Clostridium sp.]